MFIVCMFMGMAVLGCIYLDVRKKIDLLHKSVMGLFLIVVPHIYLIIYFFIQYATQNKISKLWQGVIIFEAIIFIAYLWGKVNFFPHCKKEIVKCRIRMVDVLFFMDYIQYLFKL